MDPSRPKAMLWGALRRRDAAGLASALASGASPNANPGETGGNRPLLAAIRGGWERGAAMLIDAGATIEPDAAGDAVLSLAIEWGYASIARKLLEHGACPNGYEAMGRPGMARPPLLMAIWRRRIEILSLLLGWPGIDANTPFSGTTALIELCAQGEVFRDGGWRLPMEWLLGAGADVMKAQANGETALSVLLRHEDAAHEAVRMLIGRGAKIDAPFGARHSIRQWLEAKDTDAARELLATWQRQELLSALDAGVTRPRARL